MKTNVKEETKVEGNKTTKVRIEETRVEAMKAAHQLGSRVSQVNEDDRIVWNILRKVPYVDIPLRYVAVVLNIILPGVGTMLAACLADGGKTFSHTQLWFGVVQFMTAPFIVGYFLSWYWAYLILMRSHDKEPLLSDAEQRGGYEMNSVQGKKDPERGDAGAPKITGSLR
mmetsp:Transcript_19138/g.21664  ORF Transcript_19138/g.21664 Transcript_19138/m.21664 type:complete len:170 (-) Transcript_19138:44-553(-)|eukprot:CAMPEP_0115038348 /NCGR_PEP_ID=MMETSP0216-20121206/43356_1 /TAXON_ID=223996 /ORGANISM="Protocruzia adherens, Strain Boccale" /LENGTH=169 /DNA_ID=CAMNT_0002418733 /DNA_START=98 /DNA_END=607 /DNA_ORIENTATION=-